MLLTFTIRLNIPSTLTCFPARSLCRVVTSDSASYLADWFAENDWERSDGWPGRIALKYGDELIIARADFKKKLSFDFWEMRLWRRSLPVNSNWFQTLIGYLASPNSFSTQNSIFWRQKLDLWPLKWSIRRVQKKSSLRYSLGSIPLGATLSTAEFKL